MTPILVTAKYEEGISPSIIVVKLRGEVYDWMNINDKIEQLKEEGKLDFIAGEFKFKCIGYEFKMIDRIINEE